MKLSLDCKSPHHTPLTLSSQWLESNLYFEKFLSKIFVPFWTNNIFELNSYTKPQIFFLFFLKHNKSIFNKKWKEEKVLQKTFKQFLSIIRIVVKFGLSMGFTIQSLIILLISPIIRRFVLIVPKFYNFLNLEYYTCAAYSSQFFPIEIFSIEIVGFLMFFNFSFRW